MTLPTYEDNPFWEPQNEAEAVELAVDYTGSGLDPRDYPGAFGNYADFASADLPWMPGGFEPVDMSGAQGAGSVDLAIQPGELVQRGSDSPTGAVVLGLVVEVDNTNQQVKIQPLEIGADGMLVSTGERPVMWDLDVLEPSDKQLSKATAWPNQTRLVSPDASTERNLSNAELEHRWKEFRARYPRKDGQAAELADSGLIRLWETRDSGEEFARTWWELESRGCAIELSEEPTTDLSDEELWQAGREILDGTAARRRAERRVLQAAEERAEYWRRAHERGEVLPRDLEGLI